MHWSLEGSKSIQLPGTTFRFQGSESKAYTSVIFHKMALWHSLTFFEIPPKKGNSWGISKAKYYWAVLLCVLAIDLSLGSQIPAEAIRQGAPPRRRARWELVHAVHHGLVRIFWFWNVPQKIGTFAQVMATILGKMSIKSPKLWQL